MMKRFFLFIFTLSLLTLFCPNKIFAVSIEILDAPKEITNNEFSFNVLVKGAKHATNYFRILLFKEGTHNYFGETWNGNSWIKGGDGKSYFPTSIESSSQTISLKGRLGDSNHEAGDYKLSVRRYTESGSSASSDTVSMESVKISAAEISKPLTLTDSPKATELPAKTPEILFADIETPKPKVLSENIAESLDETSTPTSSPEIIAIKESVRKDLVKPRSSNIQVGLGIIFLIFGIVSILISGWLFWKQHDLLDILKG